MATPSRNLVRQLVYGALIAAMYAALTHMQNFLIPGSATWAIQFRASEALCVLALFTPAAIPGLTVGCFVFNLTYSGALPLDMLVGSLATCLACAATRLLRRFPWVAMAMPALFNAPLVGWELSIFIGDGFSWPFFFANALNVFLGEAIVLYTAGWALYLAFKRRNLDKRLFSR